MRRSHAGRRWVPVLMALMAMGAPGILVADAVEPKHTESSLRLQGREFERDVAQFLEQYRRFLNCCAADLDSLPQVKALEGQALALLAQAQTGAASELQKLRSVTVHEIDTLVERVKDDLRLIKKRFEQIREAQNTLEAKNLDFFTFWTEHRKLQDALAAIPLDFLPPKRPVDPPTSMDIGVTPVEAVGHRVVHGGEQFHESVRIDDAVVAEFDQLNELAPLHNPGLSGRDQRCAGGGGARDTHCGGLRQRVSLRNAGANSHLCDPTGSGRKVWHPALGVPWDFPCVARPRLYGADGTIGGHRSRDHAAPRQRLLRCGDPGRQIRGHLLGFTPLEGLMMGARSGDIDPAIVSYLVRRANVSAEQVEQWLNERSGLLGLSGLSHDVRDLQAAEQQGDARAGFALEVFCYRVRKHVGAFLAVLGGADAVIFGGGISEHFPEIRARICDGMDWCGIQLDKGRSRRAVGLAAWSMTCLSADGAALPVYMAAVDEEPWIARETLRCLRGMKGAQR